MSIEDAVFLVILFIVIVVPVVGITARVALKPIVDSILRLREAFGTSTGGGVVATRVLQLEDEVKQLRATVQSLEETVSFQQKLLAGPPAEPTAAAAPDAER